MASVLLDSTSQLGSSKAKPAQARHTKSVYFKLMHLSLCVHIHACLILHFCYCVASVLPDDVSQPSSLKDKPTDSSTGVTAHQLKHTTGI